MDLRNVDYERTAPARRSFLRRLRGAALVDATVYEEVEHDVHALGQAAGIVALAALSRALGGASDYGLLRGVLADGVGWALGGVILWLIGVRVLGATSDLRELLRVLGFASAPKLWLLIGAFPIGDALRGLLIFAVWALSLLAWVIATRQALDVTTGRAAGVCVVALLPSLLLMLLVDLVLMLGV